MSNVPLARDQLANIADYLRKEHGLDAPAAEIDEIVSDLLTRATPRRRAKAQSKPMTPEKEQAIRDYAERHPHETLMGIAQTFGVNVGRVSEALAH